MIAYNVCCSNLWSSRDNKNGRFKAIYEVKFYGGSHCYKLQIINSREMSNGDHL
jgi:hypothetical protein